MVNRIEQEVLSAEYESWLREEVDLCSRMVPMLQNPKDWKDDGRQGGKTARERIIGYCDDCEGALHTVKGVSRGLL